MPARSRPDAAETAPPAAGGNGRAVVTLSPPVATAVRRMATQMDGDLGATEVVRRGLILLDVYLSLTDEEEIVIRNRQTQQLERLRIAWDSF
ncbi:MAG TPA: hypothetical protein VK611_07745 [Acidimicrobiales bacterium]|nr:hypothetical protein [Acidimicrobiales bacterium]